MIKTQNTKKPNAEPATRQPQETRNAPLANAMLSATRIFFQFYFMKQLVTLKRVVFLQSGLQISFQLVLLSWVMASFHF